MFFYDAIDLCVLSNSDVDLLESNLAARVCWIHFQMQYCVGVHDCNVEPKFHCCTRSPTGCTFLSMLMGTLEFHIKQRPSKRPHIKHYISLDLGQEISIFHHIIPRSTQQPTSSIPLSNATMGAVVAHRFGVWRVMLSWECGCRRAFHPIP